MPDRYKDRKVTFRYENVFLFFFQRRLSIETTILDVKGKYVPAVDIFSYAIRYIRDCLHKEVEIQSEDIGWVLTVPVIWGGPSKQLMRKAAENVIVNFQ